jgi:hypothetical protein
MKKIYIFISCLVLSATILRSQTVLTFSNQGLVPRTSHDFYFTTNQDEGASGANVIWDFSNLTPANKNLTSHMLNPSNLEKSGEIPEANTVIEEFGNLFYFKVSQNIIEQYGTVGCNTVTKYDVPFVKLKFPFAYGDKASGNYSGIQESNNIKTPVAGKYEISADAYGTLILPGNISINSVLRVKQIRTFEVGNPNLTEITYRWYTDDVRYPLLVIIKFQNGKESYVSQTAVYAHAGNRNKSATSLSYLDLEPIKDFSVFPSPYHDKLTISYELGKKGNVIINLYDISGKFSRTILSKTQQEAGNHTISLSNDEFSLMPGIYYVRLTLDNNSYMKKIVKQ